MLGDFAVSNATAVDQDGIGERSSYVDAEQHTTNYSGPATKPLRGELETLLTLDLVRLDHDVLLQVLVGGQ